MSAIEHYDYTGAWDESKEDDDMTPWMPAEAMPCTTDVFIKPSPTSKSRGGTDYINKPAWDKFLLVVDSRLDSSTHLGAENRGSFDIGKENVLSWTPDGGRHWYTFPKIDVPWYSTAH